LKERRIQCAAKGIGGDTLEFAGHLGGGNDGGGPSLISLGGLENWHGEVRMTSPLGGRTSKRMKTGWRGTLEKRGMEDYNFSTDGKSHRGKHALKSGDNQPFKVSA